MPPLRCAPNILKPKPHVDFDSKIANRYYVNSGEEGVSNELIHPKHREKIEGLPLYIVLRKE